jgi:hypothetical protein
VLMEDRGVATLVVSGWYNSSPINQ